MQRIESDVVIVGSGLAGSLAACRLAAHGLSVTILEAGPRIERDAVARGFRNASAVDLTSGFPNTTHAPRRGPGAEGDHIRFTGPARTRPEYLRVVGGTTWSWAGVTPRLIPADLRMKTRYGVGVDWPVDYDQLESYYAEAEVELGVSGPSTATSTPPMPELPRTWSDRVMGERLAKLGIPLEAAPVARNSEPYRGRPRCEGYGTCSPLCPSGAQYSAIVHVTAAERLGVRILENARVDRIGTNAAGQVNEAIARRPDGTGISARGRAIVLAANGYESPRILLMSASERFPAGLANGSGQVGRNFFDHIEIEARAVMPIPLFPGRGPYNLVASYRDRDGAFRRERPGHVLSVHSHSFLNDIAEGTLAQGNEPPGIDAAIRDEFLRTTELIAAIEQLPAADNALTLDWNDRDSAGQPRMRLHYALGAYAEAGVAHVTTRFEEIGQALGARLRGISKPRTRFHPMGMTRMGADPESSVVDHKCRTHDHPNLFVLGSSTFPTGGCVEPGLTIAALALRSADAIVTQLESP